MSPEVVCGAEDPRTGVKCQRWHGHRGQHEGFDAKYGSTRCWNDQQTLHASAFTPLVAETAKLEIERLKKLNEGLAERVAQQSELLSRKAAKCDCLKQAAAAVDRLIEKWKADPQVADFLCGAMSVYDTLREKS